MAIKEALASKLAAQAEAFAGEVYGPDGPDLDCDIDEIEDIAVLAARAAFDAVIARALLLQNQKLPSELPCPDCQKLCQVAFRKRSLRGRLGSAEIQEPRCHCSVCDRAFFPSAGSVAAG
jgi:hypothetical protein